ncbi:MAG: methyltransferase domain-containing protein [Lachnospiraceae bacterium]|nr:methyltransferase domain-containing protein [Lachnospiraceae bacterium]
MNKKIIDFLKNTPQVYAESDGAFWDDEHISKHMLAAHLNPDCDNASRKQDGIINSVNWIEKLCDGGSNKKLLDLGCGPGIYAEMLAAKGFQVTGIDFSKRSIDYAVESSQKKNLDIIYHYQNYLNIDYREEFDVVILIYCDLGVLSPENRRILLNKIYRALKPGGMLVLDVFHEPYIKSFEEMQSVSYEQNGFWSPEAYVVMQRNQFYEESNNTLEQYLVITEEHCKCYNIWNQIYSKEFLEKEVTETGLTLVNFFDDVQGKEYTGLEETICGVFRK